MITFAAILPHSPLLLPTVNPRRCQEAEKTRTSLKHLAEELHASRPETILFLISHNPFHDKNFTIFLHQPWRIDLTEFGDLSVYPNVEPDLFLSDQLQENLRREEHFVRLHGDPHLPYGVAGPWLLLGPAVVGKKIAVLASSSRSAKEHFMAGGTIRETLLSSPQRIAVLATGDQSHALTSDSPAGFSKEGPLYDAKIIECLEQKNPAGLLQMKATAVEAARECSYRSLLLFLGTIDKIASQPKIYSYEAPFGVGYLVANFEF